MRHAGAQPAPLSPSTEFLCPAAFSTQVSEKKANREHRKAREVLAMRTFRLNECSFSMGVAQT